LRGIFAQRLERKVAAGAGESWTVGAAFPKTGGDPEAQLASTIPDRLGDAGMAAMRYSLTRTIWWALAPTFAANWAAAEEMQTIQGTLTVAPGLADHIGPNDRLIIKLYYPKGGVELDAKYQIVPRFELPFEFTAAPSVDMSGLTKFDAYVLELFTDKDGDVLGTAPGELIARTPAPVPLGTENLRLELNAMRE
jgi:hypothetical protein